MAATKNKSTRGAMASALLMLVALLWLTISTPFVYSSRQAMATEHQQKGKAAQQGLQLPGTTEERAETGINTLSEYLHEHELPCSLQPTLIEHNKWHIAHPYLSFHPEFHCPPPNLG